MLLFTAASLVLIFHAVNDPADDLSNTRLLSKIDSGVYNLAIIALVESHTSHPEVLEELWRVFGENVQSRYLSDRKPRQTLSICCYI